MSVTALAATGLCPNAKVRVGPSASLPDCRAYELVTPENLGRTQDMTFTDFDQAIPSSDGEQIALSSIVPLEPNQGAPASIIGVRAVFSRSSTGWAMHSAVAPGMSPADRLNMSLFSPDLSQVALESDTLLNEEEFSSGISFEVGPFGGPYALVANVPREFPTEFLGANAGTTDVPAFSDVLFASTDHELPSESTERALAEETVAGAQDLYDWTEGHVRLVNVTSEGTLVSPCGTKLGEGDESAEGGATGAIAADGSRIIFRTKRTGATCQEPSRLYMRVDGRETMEVSAPQGVTLEPSERREVYYDGATSYDSKVFFSTETPLTGETVEEKEKGLTNKLFEYDTEEPEGNRLKLIASGLIKSNDNEGPSRELVVSEDGSTVYYEVGSGLINIYRYDVQSGENSFVATTKVPKHLFEPSYTTPNGEFLVFAAHGEAGELEGEGVAGEPRGAYHNELYRYDAVEQGCDMCLVWRGHRPHRRRSARAKKHKCIVGNQR